MIIATEQGTFTSSDEGESWRARDPLATEQLAWVTPDALYRADPGGLIKVSADGGESWKDVGTVGMPVNELAVDADGALYASVAGRRGQALDRRRQDLDPARQAEVAATAAAGRPATTSAARGPRPPRARRRRRSRSACRCPRRVDLQLSPSSAARSSRSSGGCRPSGAQLVGLERHLLRGAGLVGDHDHDRAAAERRRARRARCSLSIAAVTLIGDGGRGLFA